MKRIKDNYSEAHKEELYAEIQARRDDRKDEESANQFEGVTSASTKAEMVSALESDGGATEAEKSPNTPEAPADPPTAKERKEEREKLEETKPFRTANENVEAGGHPTGTVPGGTS